MIGKLDMILDDTLRKLYLLPKLGQPETINNQEANDLQTMNSNRGNQSRGGRWDDRRHNTHPPAASEDDLALAALLGEANNRSEEQQQQQRQGHRHQQRPTNNNNRSCPQHNDDRNDRPNNNYYGRSSGDKRIVEDDSPRGRDDRDGKRRRRWNDRVEQAAPSEGAPSGAAAEAAPTENPNKVKANFGLSGALANDTQTGNVYNGVTLKFSEPPEARIPNTRWRLYVFRKKAAPSDGAKNDQKTKKDNTEDGLLDTYHISRQSAYLFGRERKIADIPVDHPSLSKQHAVLQYRALPQRTTEIGVPDKLQCKPYLMDLESTNGTFINGVRLDSARYYELRKGDVITLGASSREYVLLTEQSARSGI